MERLIYLPWYEYPEPTIHLKDYTVHCNINKVYVQATPFRMDHHGCILGFSPTATDLFPTGQGDIFSLFFLKEDICYPWLWSAGLRVARNKSRFRQAWLRGEIDYGQEFPGKFFCALSSIQLKFAKFVVDISDYVINPAAGKIAICNREALAAYLALGVGEHGDWVLSQDFCRHPWSHRTPCILPLLYLMSEMHLSTFLLFICIPVFIIALISLLFRLFYSFVLQLVQRTMLKFDFPRIFLLYGYLWSFKLPAMSNILLLLVR